MNSPQGKIVIVDDDQDVLLSAKIAIRKHFSELFFAKSFDELKQLLAVHDFDVLLLDMNLRAGETDGSEGVKILSFVKREYPFIEVLMMTAYGEIDLAVKCIKKGAVDFIVKPWDNDKLLATVFSAFRLSRSNREIQIVRNRQKILQKEINEPYADIIGESEALKDVLKIVDKVAVTDANVLISGENGSGKELIARAIHTQSPRSDEIFIKVDLGALSESLFESELFGSVKGAFTDATSDRVGKFESAHKGTIFLDEIGNIPLNLQVKLLDVIQNKTIRRLGSNKEITINARIICATNMHLKEMVDEGTFRQDLLYRVNTVEITVPSLRHRKKDIKLLANHFFKSFADKYNKKNLVLAEEAIAKLTKYDFPGNIRELQHLIERTVILAEKKIVKASDIVVKESARRSKSRLDIKEVEKETILEAIGKHSGNMTKAAKELGMGRATLYRKIKEYGF